MAGDYRTALIYRTIYPNEYFLVENRARMGPDEYLPSFGLAVYHCDIFGSNEWQGGTPTNHYQCGLLQADGHLDLEKGRNYGDAGDLFDRVEGIALSHNTMPHSRMWDGSDSGLTISRVGAPTSAGGKTVKGLAEPSLNIPDNDKNGVSSTILIGESGTVKEIKVSVDITHTYIGDLHLELISPGGARIVLHDRAGGSSDNIIATFDSQKDSILSPLRGQPVGGEWRLWVADMAGYDVAKLNRWELEISMEGKASSLRLEEAPDKAIPDDDPAGIGSVINVDQDGSLENIRVGVDITHTFIGDLRVELASPGGARALLHNQEGWGTDDLVVTYDSRNVASLGALKGQPIRGSWILRVSDLSGRDVGKLNRWRLEMTAVGVGRGKMPSKSNGGCINSRRLPIESDVSAFQHLTYITEMTFSG